MNVSLTDSQVDSLARPLKEILEKFYQNPQNEEGFQKWLRRMEEEKCHSAKKSE